MIIAKMYRLLYTLIIAIMIIAKMYRLLYTLIIAIMTIAKMYRLLYTFIIAIMTKPCSFNSSGKEFHVIILQA